MKRYVNRFKYDYKVINSRGCMIINQTSCYKTTEEVCTLIDSLPYKGSEHDYEKTLCSLGINDVELIISKLYNLNILEYDEELGWKDIYIKIKKFILNPQILLIRGSFLSLIFKRLIEKIQNKVRAEWMLGFQITIISLLFIMLVLLSNISGVSCVIMDDKLAESVILMSIVILGILTHELGHSLICAYCNIGFRPISLSIFLIYPVLFTNVSGIDELDLKERCLVNIAGLTAQGIYMIVLMVIFLKFKLMVLLIAIKFLYTTFLFNLHPFLRTDGYWFFKDFMHFYEKTNIGRIINIIYYICYFVFSIFLISKGIKIFKNIFYYFINIKDKQLDFSLVVNLFYLYVAALIFRAGKNKIKECIEHFKVNGKFFRKYFRI